MQHESETGPGRFLIAEIGGARYILNFTPLSAPSCEALNCQAGSTLVTWVSGDGRSYPFAPKGYLSWEYVREKLGGSIEEARRLADLIGSVLKRPSRLPPKLRAVS